MSPAIDFFPSTEHTNDKDASYQGDSKLQDLKRHVEVLESAPHCSSSKRLHLNVGFVPWEDLGEEELHACNYLIAKVCKMMYSLVRYEHGTTMPCKGITPLSGNTNLLVPDFHCDINDPTNKLIQTRAARMGLEAESGNSAGNVPKELRDKWLTLPMLQELGHASWPNMKQIYKAHLDHAIFKSQFVHEHWVGKEWSCNEDGMKSQTWQDWLYAMGMLLVFERDDPDLDVWEVCQPVWLNKALWHFFQGAIADYARESAAWGRGKSKVHEAKRIDCRCTFFLKPSWTPYNCMIHELWKGEELLKQLDWIR
ncbi:hypothetical protein DACRYDRAFT_13449 [Dacryopinax primogenitus]|uniref:Uncharacterized protein n=1 Tax=Dacryopinax primogenitus (strain DJM 731) TaxID=1858805 RepID=M5G9F8_DACPD|nr:uncharacterized protein DACRYDRAFT_13449 [Dacryopinax primogenitus]EJU05429.1 hypothetical protein DACRYDRAFT_13449 [Dacryopinax primogenitus]